MFLSPLLFWFLLIFLIFLILVFLLLVCCMPIAASNESFGIQGNDRPLGGVAEGPLFASKHLRRQTSHPSRPCHLDLNYEELERSQILID